MTKMCCLYSIKVGDTVRVSAGGYVYSTYDEMYRKFNFPVSKWKLGISGIELTNTKGIVVGILQHLGHGDMICCVMTDEGQYFMISHLGLENVELFYIDGKSMSKEEFEERTKKPLIVHKFTKEEVEESLGFKIEIV